MTTPNEVPPYLWVPLTSEQLDQINTAQSAQLAGFIQSITDPENQPSQYGTVTLDFHLAKIKEWEDRFERAIESAIAQPEQAALPICAAYGVKSKYGFDPANGHKQLIGLSIGRPGTVFNDQIVELFTADQMREALAKAAQPEHIPAGMCLVPIEPTKAMCDAAGSVPEPTKPYPPHFHLIWDAMIAAHIKAGG